jgi:hypothetical protein
VSSLQPRTAWPPAALSAIQCLAGTVLVAGPDDIARAVSGARGTPPSAWVVRVLGLRMLAQGGVGALRPRRHLAAIGAGVDATHGASMLLVAALNRRYRRAALISGATALCSAGASAWVATQLEARLR